MKVLTSIVVTAVAVLLLAACGSAAPSASTAGNGSTTATPTPKASCTPAPCMVDAQVTVAATLANDNVQASGELDQPAAAGTYYVQVAVSVANGSSQAVDINPFGFKLQDATGQQSDAATGLLSTCPPFTDESLAPGGHAGPINMCFAPHGSPGGKVTLLWQNPNDLTGKADPLPLN